MLRNRKIGNTDPLINVVLAEAAVRRLATHSASAPLFIGI
jgi:hypothetical protein